METNRESVSGLELEAMDAIPSGVGVFDVTDSVINLKYLNDGFYRMIGARREDRTKFFGEGTINSVHPDDRAGLISEVRNAIREKRAFDYNFRNLDGNGEYIWIGIRAAHKPIGAHTERFYASYHDVDQYVSERNELRAYGKRLDSILGSIPGGVVMFYEMNGEIRLAYSNAGFYALHHGSEAYWSGQSKNPVDWLTEEDRHLFWDEFRSVKEKKKQQGSVVYRVIGEDGKRHWVSNQFCAAECMDGVQYYYASFIDMDKQLAAEQELLRDKQMYDDAAKSARLFIWSYDIVSHRLALMQSGYTKEATKKLGIPSVIENMPESLLPYILPEDHKAFVEAYHSIDRGADYAECEIRYRVKKQDAPQYEHIVLKRFCDAAGRMLAVYCYGQNVTEQRQREERFNRAYEKIDNPNSYGSFHLNLTKNWCGNGAAGKSRMKSVLELQKSGTVDGYFLAFSNLIADEKVRAEFYRRFNRELLLSQFERGTEQISIDYPVVHDDGSRHWREGFLSMMKNPNTGDIEAVTYSFDIDARKLDEFIVERLIHDHFDYIGIIHLAEKTFEFRSKRPSVRFGRIGEIYPYEECISYMHSVFERGDERRIFDETVSLDAILREMKNAGIYSASYLCTVKEKTRCVRLQYSWLEEAGGDILVFRTDNSEFYQKEQHQLALLENEKKAAEAANIAKTDFLSRMSHDIRTPLNGIIGMTYIAGRQKNPPETEDCLKKIDTSSKFLLGLVNDILDMSKAESGRMELHPEPYHLEDFRGYIDSVIRPLCDGKNQKLFYETHTVSGIVPEVDILRTNQIFFNLLSNAVKYTPEGGEIRVSVQAESRSADRVRITGKVKDNGIGISRNFQKVLFDPFTQEHRKDNSEARGTGLGLAIVKKIIDAMGGTISVKSTVGRGTEFTFSADCGCIREESGVRTEPQENAGDTLQVLQGKHVLICEDHPLNQEIVEALLREKGVLTDAAENGEAGVMHFSHSALNYYDAILMDIRMPVLDGYAATVKIRRLTRADAKNVPIVAMTADAFADDVKKCLEAGMNSHISKPIDPENLYRVLADTIKQK